MIDQEVAHRKKRTAQQVEMEETTRGRGQKYQVKFMPLAKTYVFGEREEPITDL